MVPKTSTKISLLALLLSLAGVLAIGCTARTPGAPAETATPTATASLTPTWNPTQRYQATLQFNQTQNAAHATTRAGYSSISSATGAAIALTPTATPTPTSLPAWMLTEPEDYDLAEMDAEGLLDLLVAVYLFEEESRGCDYERQDCRLVEFRIQDAWAALWLIENQTKMIPASELGEALLSRSELFQNEDLYVDWRRRHSDIFDRGFQELAVSYLNAENIRFKDGQGITNPLFTATVIQVEVDGDPESEWLLNAFFEDFTFLGWMLLDESPQGEYALIDIPFFREQDYFSDRWEIRVEDLTGDNKDELVIISDYYAGGGSYVLTFNIFTLKDNAPIQISEINGIPRTSNEVHYEYEWILHSETGLHGLELTWAEYPGWGCVENNAVRFFWAGGKEQRTEEPIGEPESISCLIARSLNYYDAPPASTGIGWLEKAIALNSASQELSLEELTFVYFQLAMLHLRNENPAAARIYLSQIQAQVGVGEPEIAVFLWDEIKSLLDENRLNPYTLCAASMASSLPILNVDSRGMIQSYDYEGNASYENPLCHPGAITLEALNGIQYDPDQASLENAIRAAGLPLIEVRLVDFGTEDAGWIAVIRNLNFGNMINMGFLSYDEADVSIFGKFAENEWKRLGILLSESFQSISKDWNGDGLPEIGFASTMLGESDYCQEGNIAFEVLWTSAYKDGVTITVSHYPYCFPEHVLFDWSEIGMDRDGDLFSDWAFNKLLGFWDYIEEVVVNDPEDVWITNVYDLQVVTKASVLGDLDERVFNTDPALTRDEIDRLIEDWSDEAPDLRDILFEHLSYLLGLTYELEGNESRAIEVYHELWSTYPDSIFGRLAASRLELRP